MEKNTVQPIGPAFKAASDAHAASKASPVTAEALSKGNATQAAYIPSRPSVTKSDNAPDGETLSKLLSDFLSNKDKSEGISAKLLKVMLDNEVRFSLTWVKDFYGKEKGTERTELLNQVILDFMDDAPQLFGTAQNKPEDVIGDIADARKREAALDAARDAKVEAQKRIKTLQNIIRACIQGLFYLRSMDASDMTVRKGKLVFDYVDPETNKNKEMRPMSFNELVTAGSKKHNAEKGSSRAARPGSNAGTETKGPVVAAAIKDAVRYVIDMLKDKDFEKLTENEQEHVRALEKLLIAKNFGDSNGVVDGKDVADYFNGECDYRTELSHDVKAA